MEATLRDSGDGIRAAYGIALRMTGSVAAAEEAVARAARGSDLAPGSLVRAVRREARLLPGRPEPVGVARPASFHGVALGDWELVERVALRGMTLTEAAVDAGLSRSDAIVRLQRGMRAACACTERGQAAGDTQATAARALCRDRSSGRLDDPTGDRQAQAASLTGLPA